MLKNQIANSVFWIVWSRGAVQAVSFLSTLMVARFLNPADYGLMALAASWTYIITLAAELGLGAAIVQFRDLDADEINACFWLIMGTAALGYLALYAGAPAIAAWFGSPLLSDVLRVVAFNLPLVAVRRVPENLLRKRLALDKISQAETISALVTVPVVLGMAWSGAGVWALVAGTLVMSFVQNALSFWFAGWWPGFRTGSRRLRELLRYSLATLGSGVGWATYAQADAFVLGKVSGDVVLGFYSMAKQLANAPVEKVSVVAMQLAWPIMARLQTDRAAMRAYFLRGLRLVACLMVPLCIGTALVAGDLVRVALGHKWTPTVPVLQVLCLSALIHSLSALLPPILFATYRAAFMFRWTGTLLLVMPLAFWVAADSMGALGVALAWVVVHPIMRAWMARAAFREIEVGWRSVWEQLRPVIGPAVMMVACVLGVHWIMPGSHFVEQVVRLAASCGLGALVYGAGIVWRGGALVGEIREVVGWLYRPNRSRPGARADHDGEDVPSSSLAY